MDCVVELSSLHTTELKDPYTLNIRKLKLSFTEDPLPHQVIGVAQDPNLSALFGTAGNINR
jgi:hypothetical protein